MDQTWESDEFGASHRGRVGVLLADGSVPGPVYFDAASGAGGQTVTHWSVYDGRWPNAPRAACLQAVCSCGWAGPEHRLDWEAIGKAELHQAGLDDADRCQDDFDRHITDIDRRAVSLPAELETLLDDMELAIEQLAKDAPVAAVRAARRLEILAGRTGYTAAHASLDQDPEQVAAALGLNTDQTRTLLARFGRWSPYSY
ncbi:hypothetical protein ACFVGY_37575 [Streptomyces sp. NPDC127106]|uniref:hypothetical protein n=1 Tax=Streptomyces sp. NPDC127106 TaxID=3345360 RepID=UPI003644CB7C